MDHDYKFGIEEEYFLADGETGRSPSGEAADRFHASAADAVEPAAHELLKGQVEVSTAPGTDVAAARGSLLDLRRRLVGLAGDQGLVLFAAGSHPLGMPGEQATTEEDRYEKLAEHFGIISQRSMCCAMHVHVEVPDPDARIALMNRLTPALPVFLALSTSSPFWEGRASGLHGFRLAAFSQWPRMGLPEIFADDTAYRRLVDRLVGARVMEDASFVWWLIRPSIHYPTIELRIADSCTRLDDAVAIAALYRGLVRCAVRRPDFNAGFGPLERAVCAENIWQAQRRGIAARFVDPAGGATLSVAESLERLLAAVAEDAAALGCEAEVAATRDILRDGSSADRQLALFREAKARGVPTHDALRDVILALATTTIA